MPRRVPSLAPVLLACVSAPKAQHLAVDREHASLARAILLASQELACGRVKKFTS